MLTSAYKGLPVAHIISPSNSKIITMKKSVLATLLLFAFLISNSQGKSEYVDFDIPTKDGNAFYEKVDSVFGKTKDQIYQAAKKTISDVFGNAKAVIEIDDKEAAQIIGKGTFDINHKIQMGVNETTTIKFTLNVQGKDGRYRIQMYDFQKRSSQEKSYTELSHVLTYAKGWRTKFFPAFNEKAMAVMSVFTVTIKKNLGADSDF
jgi:hypothetical protein